MVYGTMCKAHSPKKYETVALDETQNLNFLLHSDYDYTTLRAIPYKPKVVGGKASLQRCKITSIS